MHPQISPGTQQPKAVRIWPIIRTAGRAGGRGAVIVFPVFKACSVFQADIQPVNVAELLELGFA